MKTTQKQFVIDRLLKTGKITRNYCLRNYISRLGSIICRLKSEGYQFKKPYYKETKTIFGKSKDYVYEFVGVNKFGK